GATLGELARVIRPGGVMAMLEFAVPHGLWRPPWELYVRIGLPAAGAVAGPGWRGVGRFLGGSIRRFWARTPERAPIDLWRDAGRAPALGAVRARRLRRGGGIVVGGGRA